jgi:hypothetical protein
MKQVKTAKGLVIDMGALAKMHEETIAVSPGNTRMNARGDVVGASGNVIQTTQAISRAAHDTTNAPQKKKMSESLATPSRKKPMESAPKILSKTQKERPDGSVINEIEYDDGSIEIEEIE